MTNFAVSKDIHSIKGDESLFLKTNRGEEIGLLTSIFANISKIGAKIEKLVVTLPDFSEV